MKMAFFLLTTEKGLCGGTGAWYPHGDRLWHSDSHRCLGGTNLEALGPPLVSPAPQHPGDPPLRHPPPAPPHPLSSFHPSAAHLFSTDSVPPALPYSVCYTPLAPQHPGYPPPPNTPLFLPPSTPQSPKRVSAQPRLPPMLYTVCAYRTVPYCTIPYRTIP